MEHKSVMLDELKEIVGEGGWREGQDIARYLEDPRDRFHGLSQLVLLPKSTQQVAQIVSLCAKNQIRIVPYSGGTGVVAGQLSTEDQDYVLLSMERMNAIRDLALEDGAIIVEAGCVLADIQSAADEVGMMFPLSMASEGSCQIGGNLATNAGGIQVLRYGNARDLCIGIEAVLPDGSVLSELSPLRKNNTGYDLRHLLIGSEGTLGIITAATLQLKPKNPETTTVFCGISKPEDAVTLLRQLRMELGDVLSAFELLSNIGLQVLQEKFPEERQPLGSAFEWYVLIEAAGDKGLRDNLEGALGNAFESGLVLDAVIAESYAQQEALWRLREMMPEANRLAGAICNSDTSVPISQIGNFIDKTFAAINAIDPALTVNCYGHVGDGNIHCNVFPPDGMNKQEMLKTQAEKIEAIRMCINETTAACHGSISAEHGIGRLKVADLERYGNAAKILAMKQIKSALDPHNIMNPGVFF
ncbi:FAD-binding oxidoreductase [Ahrensia marina]|uniref:FAD-binding oxidoreductase n=1 Tax=Ahrensia marina TaxID=1514904 RepID=A0A0M9GPN0_9HYPH|nr:FAD-binding oxidoreductase [Ahrensia marina]